jgi:nitrogen fixation/metabolism regulation signal transduction histidine kinase
MTNPIAPSNLSFSFLRNSPDFLNIVLSEMSSCILLLNKDMMLHAFNEPIKTIFSNREDEYFQFKKCGQAIGCAYTVEEGRECGTTSHCSFCELRECGIETYLTQKPHYKKQFSRHFYRTDTHKELKHLQFSTRFFKYKLESYVMVIIDDITELVNMKNELEIKHRDTFENDLK